MQPIRNVYPMSAFNILIDAYCTAVNSSAPLEGRQFVMDYARTQYGLTPADAEMLWEYFTHPQEILHRGGKDSKNQTVDEVLQNCIKLRDKFAKVVSKKNQQEFEHYKLILDIRINYLDYKKIEIFYESPAYDRSHDTRLMNELKSILAEAEALDKRFVAINKGYLKENQSEYINGIRTEKMKALYQWLMKNQ
ncbi:MAG: hypothetical protein LUH22_05970 [Bacteroides sp.]|nr:hypothetical protein [Bacteroides sp.]